MARNVTLGGSRLFEGLTEDELDVVASRMRPRQFSPGEQLCAAGDASDRIWLITGGLVNWTAGTTTGGGTNNFGTVFALTPPAPGQTNWTESVLYSFTGGADGGYPSAALTDLRGALYSTASSFGSLGAGASGGSISG